MIFRLRAVAAVSVSALVAYSGTGPPQSTRESQAALSFKAAGGYGEGGTFQIALGDLDADGDLDAVFGNMGDSESEVWLNDGDGRFARSQPLGPEGHGVALGDLDGDADPDLFLAGGSHAVTSRVWLNDGSGRFTALDHDVGDRSQAANAVSLFDVDGDGDLDAGVYYSARFTTVYRNDGTGRFRARDPAIPGMLAWGDVDGDGDVDAVRQRFEGGYTTLLNSGDGTLIETGLVDAPSAFIPGGVALADLDADGDLDVVAANGGETPTAPLTVLRNDGPGRFDYVPEGRLRVTFGRVTPGDLDGDGHADVFVGCFRMPACIAVNDGHGGLTDTGLRIGGEALKGISAIGDLDGDGDNDLFVAIYDPPGPNTVWLNTASRRQPARTAAISSSVAGLRGPSRRAPSAVTR